MLKPAIGAALALVTACAAQTRTDVPTLAQVTAAPVVLGEATRGAPETFGPPAAYCDIRETRTPRGLRLEAIAEADQSVDGVYDFVITAKGSGGSSDISQGGPVALNAGERAVVGVAEIPAGRYSAVLTLSDADGELCRVEQQS